MWYVVYDKYTRDVYVYIHMHIYITEALLHEYVCRSFEIPNLWSIFTLYYFLPKLKKRKGDITARNTSKYSTFTFNIKDLKTVCWIYVNPQG